MTIRWRPGVFVLLAAIAVPLLSSFALLHAWAYPPDREAKTVTGRVERLTTAPRGEIDGAVLDNATIVHWPPHLGDHASRVAAKGDRVLRHRLDGNRPGRGPPLGDSIP